MRRSSRRTTASRFSCRPIGPSCAAEIVRGRAIVAPSVIDRRRNPLRLEGTARRAQRLEAAELDELGYPRPEMVAEQEGREGFDALDRQRRDLGIDARLVE